MTHQPFEEMLARRAELTPAERAQLEDHLEDCPECRATSAAYEQQTRLLRAMPAVDPPPALRAGVMAGIAERQTPRRRWWQLSPALLAAPAALAVVIAVALALNHGTHPSNNAASNSAARFNRPSRPPTPVYGFGAASKRRGGKSHPGRHPAPHHPAAGSAATAVEGIPPTAPPQQGVAHIAIGPPPTSAASGGNTGAPSGHGAPRNHPGLTAGGSVPVGSAGSKTQPPRPPQGPVPTGVPSPVPVKRGPQPTSVPANPPVAPTAVAVGTAINSAAAAAPIAITPTPTPTPHP